MTTTRAGEKINDAVIAGVGMTRFAKHPDRTLRSLVEEATAVALADSGAAAAQVGAIFFGNAAAGLLNGQEMLRGQHMLEGSELEGIPLVNVENACASSSTAARMAWRAVVTGEVEVAMAIGSEKMSGADRERPFRALSGALDVERHAMEDYALGLTDQPAGGGGGSVFMDLYAADARRYMERTGATARDYAEVVARTRFNGSLNPKAQFRTAVTAEDVLASRMIAEPLTRDMCSPIADGAACLVLAASGWNGADADSVAIRSIAIGTGVADGGSEIVRRTSTAAYEEAGIGPDDLDVVELHDAAATAELQIIEELGIAAEGKAADFERTGATRIGGALPINTSGGLISRGHPIGATGAAQLVELVEQLRGRSGERQVEGARIALAENAGGHLGSEAAACVVTVLSSD